MKIPGIILPVSYKYLLQNSANVSDSTNPELELKTFSLESGFPITILLRGIPAAIISVTDVPKHQAPLSLNIFSYDSYLHVDWL